MKSIPKDKSNKPRHAAHDDARVVMVRPMVVTAGGSFSHAPLQAARLVIAGNPKPLLEGLPGYTPVVIKLDWPDMAIPDMTAADWRWLTGRIRALRRPLHVSCAMGHGRTGSCLALLAHFWSQIPRGADPVQWVRNHYCAEAIETAAQIAYIERMTGRASKCKPKESVPTSTDYSYDGSGFVGDYGPSYGTPYTPTGKAFKSFPNNAASIAAEGRALAMGTHGAAEKVRWCIHIDAGRLCPKPAAEGQLLCDRHFFDTLPPTSAT